MKTKSKHERIDATRRENAMLALGFSPAEYETLRRASMALSRWAEYECTGMVQRDETTNIPYWYSIITGDRLSRAVDRETNALKRIAAIQRAHPDVTLYVQGDPRGCALYAVPSHVLADGAPVNTCYSRGIAIY